MTGKKEGFKYALSAPMRAGLDNLKRLNLNAEASMTDNIETAGDFSQVLISAHAPSAKDGMRLNIAATDDEFREMSIATIVDYVKTASRYPNLKQVNMHFAPKQWVDESQTAGQIGDYDRLIEGIRRIGAFADGHGIEIVLENHNAYWLELPDSVPPELVDWTDRNTYFGMAPEEWVQVCEDVARPNVALTLDSSHICTYAHTFPVEQRKERVLAFLSKPHLIRHVHWSDNYLYDLRGRRDSHAIVGKGSLPIELHRRIKALDATILLEHFYTVEELEAELEFVDRL